MDATKKRAEKLQAKGKTIDFKALLRMEPDGGTANIRNVNSKHWTRWLGVENRCVMPFKQRNNPDLGASLSRLAGPANAAGRRLRSARVPPDLIYIGRPNNSPITPEVAPKWSRSCAEDKLPRRKPRGLES